MNSFVIDAVSNRVRGEHGTCHAAREPVRGLEQHAARRFDADDAGEAIRRGELGQLLVEELEVHVRSLRSGTVVVSADIAIRLRPAVEDPLDDGARPPRHPAVLVSEARLRTMDEPQHASERLRLLAAHGQRVARGVREEVQGVAGPFAEPVRVAQTVGVVRVEQTGRREPVERDDRRGDPQLLVAAPCTSCRSCTVNSMSDSDPRPSLRWNCGSSPGLMRSRSMRAFILLISRTSDSGNGSR